MFSIYTFLFLSFDLRCCFYSSAESSFTQHSTCFYCYVQLDFFFLKLFKSLCSQAHLFCRVWTQLVTESCRDSVPAVHAEPFREAKKLLVWRKSTVWISSSNLQLETWNCVSQLLADMGLKIWSFFMCWSDQGNTETARGHNLLGDGEACDLQQCERISPAIRWG